MGLFDFVGDVVDTVREGVQTGARTVAGGAKEFLERAGSFGNLSLGPSILDKIPFIHDNPLVKIAGSPILSTAQLAIGGMKATTGSGEPEDGEGFKASAESLAEAGETLMSTDAVSDLWDGDAAAQYTKQNSTQRHEVLEVHHADQGMQRILSKEAGQVAGTLQTLTDRMDFLADFDTATSWMNLVPGGAVAKAAIDLPVATAAVTAAKVTLGKLVWDSMQNALEIQDLVSRYEGAAEHKMLEDGSCAPFGDEHQAGTLPSRTQSDQYTPPIPEGPAVEYPPAISLPRESAPTGPATPNSGPSEPAVPVAPAPAPAVNVPASTTHP